jgi:hypothetical protein
LTQRPWRVAVPGKGDLVWFPGPRRRTVALLRRSDGHRFERQRESSGGHDAEDQARDRGSQ